MPENIYFASINYDTGLRSNFNDKKSIVEAFKSENIKTKSNNNLNNLKDYAIVEKFKNFIKMGFEIKYNNSQKIIENIRGIFDKKDIYKKRELLEKESLKENFERSKSSKKDN